MSENQAIVLGAVIAIVRFIALIYLFFIIVKLIYSKLRPRCKHAFDLGDIRKTGEDDSPTRITWTCWRCGQQFKANCGLDILKHGTCKKKEEL